MHGYIIPAIAVVLLLAIGLVVLLSCKRHSDHSAQVHDRSATRRDIQRAIQRLLDATPTGEKGGFVIFSGHRDLDYVQFALEPNGLLLNWPTIQEDGPERLPMFRQQLERRGFQHVPSIADGPPISKQIANLQTGQFMIVDDGLYAQTGHSAAQNCDLTIALLRDIFGVTDLTRVEITLDP